jgi:hypothetical protein
MIISETCSTVRVDGKAPAVCESTVVPFVRRRGSGLLKLKYRRSSANLSFSYATVTEGGACIGPPRTSCETSCFLLMLRMS